MSGDNQLITEHGNTFGHAVNASPEPFAPRPSRAAKISVSCSVVNDGPRISDDIMTLNVIIHSKQ